MTAFHGGSVSPIGVAFPSWDISMLFFFHFLLYGKEQKEKNTRVWEKDIYFYKRKHHILISWMMKGEEKNVRSFKNPPFSLSLSLALSLSQTLRQWKKKVYGNIRVKVRRVLVEFKEKRGLRKGPIGWEERRIWALFNIRKWLHVAIFLYALLKKWPYFFLLSFLFYRKYKSFASLFLRALKMILIPRIYKASNIVVE